MRPRRTEQQWRKIFDKFDRSGLTQEQFCHREDLALATFANWRRKIRATSMAPVPASFVEVCIPTQSPMVQPEGCFPQSDELVVELPYGVVLRFRGVRP